ncbi:Vacuolar protein-sorting-associated protein 25 [Grifola frondosa]|uniref:Vacuolar protein-sorting-associated protein 25 n=1 Tax=Grifola frondosa TaxID=5627 RepID=A0A1C7MFA0_GRIFR|nr:Vacuolar protein-sorting-associated protein 25 [Grifola frondosa]
MKPPPLPLPQSSPSSSGSSSGSSPASSPGNAIENEDEDDEISKEEQARVVDLIRAARRGWSAGLIAEDRVKAAYLSTHRAMYQFLRGYLKEGPWPPNDKSSEDQLPLDYNPMKQDSIAAKYTQKTNTALGQESALRGRQGTYYACPETYLDSGTFIQLVTTRVLGQNFTDIQMALSTYTTPSGFLLPSIHSAPPFFTQQPNSATQAIVTEQWTRLIMTYSRHRKLFVLRIEDAEVSGNDWDEIFRNDRINRRLLPSHLSFILADMVSKNLATYDPPKQTRSALLYWRLPEDWAEVLHEWVNGHLNTILTFYEIMEPPVPSPLSGIPLPLLRKAIDILVRTNRAQIITIADGEGVRILPVNVRMSRSTGTRYVWG